MVVGQLIQNMALQEEEVSPVSGDGEMYPHYAQYSVDYDPNCPYVNGMTAVSNSTALPSYAEWRRAQVDLHWRKGTLQAAVMMLHQKQCLCLLI